MTDFRVPLTAAERERLDACPLEPIRIPNAIQSHGVLLSLDPASLQVLQVSDNTPEVFGEAATVILGSTLVDLIGASAVEQCRAILESRGLAANPVPVHVNRKPFDAIVHEADGVVIAEFEPFISDGISAATVHAAIHRLNGAGSVADIYAQTAVEFGRLTGFDRVVIYKFHDDGHGEVVAEEVVEGLEPYLGLHFPASDIPEQARQLYLSKLCRVIVLGEEPPAALVPVDNPLTGTSLDLGHAELRSVSPHHVEFMKNMGQATTMSLSLIHLGQLIGMITCSHRSPVRIPFLLREGYSVLARQVSMQLGAAAEIERLRRLDAVRTVRARLGFQVTSGEDIAAALLRGDITLLDLIPADGATLHLNHVSTSMGDVPDVVIGPGVLAELAAEEREIVVSESISEDYPRLHAIMPGFAGVLVVPFGAGGDYLAWFRHETISTVRWLGDQTAANRASPLTPRNSFAMWSESVAGRSEPWDSLGLLEASKIRHDLNAVLLRAAESELARFALHDPLTGLPNRRLLDDRMAQALAKRERGTPVAVLFADLDGFKLINDAHGHAVGDAVIVSAAGLIRAVMRNEDTVARIGGDEFVVLCEDADGEGADVAAARILDAFAAPVEADGVEYRVGISIGIALADKGQSGDDLLRAADAAMYRAKENGRGRASH